MRMHSSRARHACGSSQSGATAGSSQSGASSAGSSPSGATWYQRRAHGMQSPPTSSARAGQHQASWATPSQLGNTKPAGHHQAGRAPAQPPTPQACSPAPPPATRTTARRLPRAPPPATPHQRPPHQRPPHQRPSHPQSASHCSLVLHHHEAPSPPPLSSTSADAPAGPAAAHPYCASPRTRPGHTAHEALELASLSFATMGNP
jgi:hypothetical protein